ncbi:DUF362 domain-containing protein [Desulfohalovibrio reitneri]|uniref:DUF362 domain-containing protein n=1 Tax=Desulfohalovibrio reitneri TaxID=1307759 RepID=UPI0004A71A22|nr:DUF362 domain-containing protein [Desulfohalovibrio reitneri]
MDRRSFLTLAGAAWFASNLWGRGLWAATATPDAAVVTGGPGEAARAAVEMLGGMGRFVKPGQKVVIKPNMSFPTPPEKGANTHPAVVQAIAAMCSEVGAAEIHILDNPLSSAERCLEASGIQEACRDMGGRVQALTADRFYKEADIEAGEDMKENAFVREVLEADVLIAAPTAKSHGATGVSLGLKGMMGLIRDRGAMHWRYDLDTAIVDLNTRLKADLTVVDGMFVLSTGGPYGPGKVLKEDTVIASPDPVAADALAVEAFAWYGRRFEARQVKHVRLAAERGLGSMDTASLRVKRLAL